MCIHRSVQISVEEISDHASRRNRCYSLDAKPYCIGRCVQKRLWGWERPVWRLAIAKQAVNDQDEKQKLIRSHHFILPVHRRTRLSARSAGENYRCWRSENPQQPVSKTIRFLVSLKTSPNFVQKILKICIKSWDAHLLFFFLSSNVCYYNLCFIIVCIFKYILLHYYLVLINTTAATFWNKIKNIIILLLAIILSLLLLYDVHTNYGLSIVIKTRQKFNYK